MIQAFARYRIEGSLYFHPTERFTGLNYSHILIHFQFVLLEFTNHRNKKSSCCTRLFLTREFLTKSSFLKSLSYDP